MPSADRRDAAASPSEGSSGSRLFDVDRHVAVERHADLLPHMSTSWQKHFERDDFSAPGWPKLSFLEHRFAGDETNWWAPNHAGVEAMLRACGLGVPARPGHYI